MSKFLRNFEIDQFDDDVKTERIKKKPQSNSVKRKSKSNKPKRGKIENWD